MALERQHMDDCGRELTEAIDAGDVALIGRHNPTHHQGTFTDAGLGYQRLARSRVTGYWSGPGVARQMPLDGAG
jgi:hypothetical protein